MMNRENESFDRRLFIYCSLNILIGLFFIFSACFTYFIYGIQNGTDASFLANTFAGLCLISSGIYSLIKKESKLSSVILSGTIALTLSLFVSIIIFFSEEYEPRNNYCFALLEFVNPIVMIVYYLTDVKEDHKYSNYKTLWLIILPIVFYSVISFFVVKFTDNKVNDNLFTEIYDNNFFSLAFIILVYFLSYAIGSLYLLLNKVIYKKLRKGKN